MISEKDKKLLAVISAVSGVLLILWLVQNFYTSATGKLLTEFALNYTQVESVHVDGFAVRDEGTFKNGKNSSFLYKNSSKYYVPLVEDSANVSNNDSIAIAFADEASAVAYRERVALREKITALKELKSQGGLSYLNVVGLNSLIYTSAVDYADSVSKGKSENLHKIADNFTQRLTTKQIATGEKPDFDAAIKEYTDEYDALRYSLGSYQRVYAPRAGYFVSNVDGFENVVAYSDVVSKKLNCKSGEKFFNAESENYENVYGKIVGQFTWYFVFDMSASQLSSMNEGSVVYVNFPAKGINNIKMTVYDISEAKDSVITVTLRCKMMNEELVTLRKEKAEIVIKSHNGLKINQNAIVKNDEGIDGVYVLSGNYVEFSPIDIKYYGEDYVIADKYYVIRKDEKGKSYIDYEETDKYRSIKLYDNIIVKGKNLYDGKIIG